MSLEGGREGREGGREWRGGEGRGGEGRGGERRGGSHKDEYRARIAEIISEGNLFCKYGSDTEETRMCIAQNGRPFPVSIVTNSCYNKKLVTSYV